MPVPHTRINSKWTLNLHVFHKTIKLLNNTLEKYFSDLGNAKILRYIKGKFHKEKIPLI